MAWDESQSEGYWRSIRSKRAARPLRAEKGARSAVFTASLEQSEQLWRAAEHVTPQASPILLFYSLAQAGRALCAAGVPHANGWRPREQHGLKFRRETTQSGDLSLETALVSERGQGLFQQVAELAGSPGLEREESVGRLIAALGEVSEFAEFSKHPRPLRVFEPKNMLGKPPLTVTGRIVIGPAPKELADAPASPAVLSEAAAWLAQYPRLAPLGTPSSIEPVPPNSLDRRPDRVIVSWPVEAGSPDQSQEGWVSSLLDSQQHDGWGRAAGAVLPAIGGNSAAQHPLITWWLTLYTLSMLARYCPEEWSSLLDVDSSRFAVGLDSLLGSARVAVPFFLDDFIERIASVDAPPLSTG